MTGAFAAMRLAGLHPFRGATNAGVETMCEVRNLFVFICGVKLDEHGFVFTGAPAQAAEGLARAALESSVPGVYAVGDARSGSLKRVGGAIGEGTAAMALIHAYLSKLRGPHRALLLAFDRSA